MRISEPKLEKLDASAEVQKILVEDNYSDFVDWYRLN
jgi:hypothetical protein